jgi:hypothetical protein
MARRNEHSSGAVRPQPGNSVKGSTLPLQNSKLSKMDEVARLSDDFVALTVSDVDRQSALERLRALLARGPATVADVVQQLGPALTDANAVVRARGVLLLASLRQTLPVEKLGEEQLGFLLTFLRDRSRDGPCVGEVIAGMRAVVGRWGGLPALPVASVEAMLVTVFAEMFVQGLDQATRLAAYELMETVLKTVPAAAVALRHDFVYAYLQMIDGERDPRNLLFVFGLTPRILAQVPGWERLAEELFDVTACYYPINYKPRGENDPITPDMLSDALDAAMTCTVAYAPYFYPFMMEKLEGEHAHLWRSLARSIAAFGDGGKALLPHAPIFAGALAADAFGGRDAAAVQGACEAATELLRALAADLVTENTDACTLDPLLGPLLQGALPRLAVPDSKDALVAGALLAAYARAAPEAARRVCARAVPALCQLVMQQPSEGVAVVLNDVVGASVAAGEGLAKRGHPLAAHAEALLAAGLQLCAPGSAPRLREAGALLLERLCFQTPLASFEAQGAALARALERGPDAALRAVAAMSAELQTSLALPRLLRDPSNEACCAGLCALRPSVALPDGGEALCAALLERREAALAAAALGSFANKGQVGAEAVASKWQSSRFSSSRGYRRAMRISRVRCVVSPLDIVCSEFAPLVARVEPRGGAAAGTPEGLFNPLPCAGGEAKPARTRPAGSDAASRGAAR